MRYFDEKEIIVSNEIEWLPTIPKTWKLCRLKDYSSIETGIKNTEDKIAEGIYPFFVRSQTVEYSDTFSYEGEAILTAGDGVGVGKVFHHYNGKFETHQRVYRICKFKKLSGRFLFYYISENLNKETSKYNSKSTVDSLRMPTFQRFPLLIPPFEEQTAIAQYLDTKTQAIDKKIKLLIQKSNHYKELRNSIINDAVCKGLGKKPPTLVNELGFHTNSKYVTGRLKDIGFLYSGLSGKAGDDFNQEDNPNNKGFIPFTNIANNTYLKTNHLGTVIVYENEHQNKVRKGDLFFLMSSEGYEDIGKTAVLVDDIKDTYLNSFCKGYRITNKNCDPNFLNYLLLSDNYRKVLIVEGKGFTRINLKMEKVSDFIVFLPPTKEEQIQIATYLDRQTQKIDAILANIKKQTDTLNELRKTLINDVVTGKIKFINF